ncbi:MAG: prepilin-type N-terminal cleavage/methylation domain-containing protein [Rubrivivax sp.]|nr:MAG: prepilin-type N-terminal cleavage/methylation domain-containing protein [Rubrivivax sp.]
MRALHAIPHRLQRAGFTLIELMVGMALGLLTVAIIAQVVVVSEGQKRTTTNGTDAQISGALALYAVQHEVQMSGYGLTGNPAAMGCTVKYQSGAITGNFVLVPVTIDDDGHGSDIITVLRSSKSTFSTPIKIKRPHAQTDTAFTVSSTVGVNNGDLLIAVPNRSGTPVTTDNCAVIQVNDSPAGTMTSTVIPHAASASTPWNPSDPTTIMPATAYPIDTSYLVNLGNMVMNRYSINNDTHTLQISSMSRAGPSWSTPIDVQPQVVLMKALYGTDTNADNVVDTYARTTPADWSTVKSVRVLIVARSAQYEKDVVSANADIIDAAGNLQWNVGSSALTVTGSTVCHTSSKCLSIPLTFLGTDWNHYRYKIYDTVIPLRNVMWNS